MLCCGKSRRKPKRYRQDLQFECNVRAPVKLPEGYSTTTLSLLNEKTATSERWGWAFFF